MKAEEFIEALEKGKNVYRNTGALPVHLTMVKHPKGTYVYMDVPNGVFVTVDAIWVDNENQILGLADGTPVLTILTEEWFV